MPRSYEAADPTRHFPSPDTETWRHFGDGYAGKVVGARLQGYDSSTLSYIDVVVDSTGQLLTASGAGGGGAATIADGADVAQGSTSDVAWVSGSGTLIAISKAEFAKLEAIRALLAGTLTVGAHNVTNAGTFAVQATGTVTANAGSNLNTSALALDATLTGGTQKTKLVDSAGTNAAAVSAAGRVSVDASGVAVPITDNAGSLTVDAPVGTPAFVRLSDGAAAITTLPVSLATNTPDVTDRAARLLGHVTVDSAPSTAVTNAGTFAVQAAATLAAETTKVIGTVNVAAAQTIAATQSGTWTVQPGNTPNTSPWLASVHDGTTKAKVTVANAQPANTDGALLVNAIDTFAGTVLASASRGVAVVNTDLVNYNGKGIRVWQDLTVLGASSVCQFSIQEKDPVSGKFITLLASAATGAGINGTGTAKLTVYPGLTAAANVTASDVVPMNIRIVSTVTTAASTFSIGYSLIP